jgi:PAS domain S-box-containing protein
VQKYFETIVTTRLMTENNPKYSFKNSSVYYKLSFPIGVALFLSLANLLVLSVLKGFLLDIYVETGLIFLAISSIFVLLIAWLILKNYVSKPLESLQHLAQDVAKGNLEVETIGEQTDEIGNTAQAIGQLAYNIKKAREFAENIGQGNYEIESLNGRADATHQDTLFTTLIGMRNQLKEVAEEDGKRNWITQGMAEFAHILRSDDTDLKQLSTKIITGLIRYVNASQGALFILKEETSQQYLELTACYAYQESQQMDKKIYINENFGEGLVGQSFLEKETIYITNIPDEYINISSGLGSANPKSILFVPLELNGKVEGVIELASFYAFEPYQIEFVEKLAENITSAVLTIKINDHTKLLLKESQALAQQLQLREKEIRQNYEALRNSQEMIENKNKLIEDQKEKIEKALAEQTEKSRMLEEQEEEMRQNMEELVVTQEKMMITQAELDGQLNAINNSSIGKVEYDLKGNVVTANQAFCNMVGYSIDELKGINHNIFIENVDVKLDIIEHDHFWNELRNAHAQTGEYKRLRKNKEIVWMNAVYSPVIDKQGKPYKIIKLAFDITEAKNLLSETQKQAAILRHQEQELRQNMLELQATQDELRQKSQAIIQLKEEEARNAKLKAIEIESKNQLITASIQYAKNIQRAILPSEEVIKQTVNDFFAVFLPKDIVSGDFYWFSHIEDKTFFAAVDCTGHGVPGAFMSIIGNTLLNEIVNVQKIFDTAKILELLHMGVRSKLRQAESSNNDGMDIAICMLENTQKTDQIKIHFSGAKRPFYYWENNTLKELKGDRKAIGGWQQEIHRTFTKQELFLKKGDSIYLLSDGLMDNPNPKRKKFGTQYFEKLIRENAQKSLNQQKLVLLEAIASHQQSAEQRDDITVLGIKI